MSTTDSTSKAGLSTAAGIPTGWQIVERLIEQVAVVEALEVDDDPAEWYEETFKEPPTYSRLVARLGLSPSDRHALISGFLDLGDGDGERQPTLAHRSIARLMRGGFVG